ncbi:phosphotransferase [Candidatus Berkelbacteria bacterium]|nr:phosphotransferase [Candidatus Berkelbacteria bacterium]
MRKWQTPYRVRSETRRELEKYFHSVGFEVLDAFDTREGLGHHLFGKLRRGGILYFFKITQTAEFGNRIANELTWNNAIGTLLNRADFNWCTVPVNINSGKLGDKKYYVAPYYSGHGLASQSPPGSGELARWLDRIVATSLFFQHLKGLRFPRDERHPNLTGEFITATQKRFDQIGKRYRLEPLIREISGFHSREVPTAINHGDFVPWHMINHGDRFVLVDGEYASSTMPAYYDVVFFFQRTYINTEAPELAKQFLKRFFAQLLKSEQRQFEWLYRFILASRIISTFWHAERIGQTDLRYEHRLKREFLRNELLN